MISTITINSLTLGTFSSGYLFTQLEGFDFPKVRIDIKDRGQYHGARLGAYNYGRRLFTISGQIIGSSESDYESKRRAFQQALDLDGGLTTMQITTKAGLMLQTSVIVAADIQMVYQKGQMTYSDFQIQLVAPFPYMENTAQTTQVITQGSGGGVIIPMTIPADFSNGGTGTQSVTNNGNAKAFPIITITGALQNPSIQNVTSSKTLSLTYTLATGTDSIVLDFYNRTAMLNGATNVLQYVSGDWWQVQPGANSLKLTASVTGTGNASVVFRDAYLGV